MAHLSRRLALTGTALVVSPSVARAQTLQWRMATSWPRNLAGPGFSARRLAERIGRLSGGRIEVQVFAAGELVPAFAVHEAVGQGTVELGHTASFFASGREPALAFFTTIPFGLTPVEQAAWLQEGGGQALWDEAQAPFGIKPFAGGNTGVSMGGWFRRELANAEALRGLKIRMVGLGAELFQRLGATAIAVPPGEIFASLERGAIDAAEFTSPGSDLALGLWTAAPFYYAPGFNKPNGSSEFAVNRALFDRLTPEFRAIIEAAVAAEPMIALAEMERLNMDALGQMVSAHGVRLRGFPTDLIQAARREARDIVQGLGRRSALAARVVDSYSGFQARLAPWTRLGWQAAFGAREV